MNDHRPRPAFLRQAGFLAALSGVSFVISVWPQSDFVRVNQVGSKVRKPQAATLPALQGDEVAALYRDTPPARAIRSRRVL